MFLKTLSLQNFRSYSKKTFNFDPVVSVIIGPNASGKTNLIEAITLLATGKSFRTSREKQLLGFGSEVARITGQIISIDSTGKDIQESDEFEIVLANSPTGMLLKKYLLNGVSKRRANFVTVLPIVLFTPLDLDIVTGQPGARRRFLDEVLTQTDPHYNAALLQYAKALRQRNALLEYVQKTGRRDKERFSYWDNLLITNASIITQKREEFLAFINQQEKTLFPFFLTYDKSVMSQERLLYYQDAEVGAGVTLVGPQRDDIFIKTFHPVSNELEDVKYFCSRGQQRLVTLELKKTQISYLNRELQTKSLLLLDDIFSELDNTHIGHVLDMTHDHQTIITTTHKEFINLGMEKSGAVIELG